VHLKKIAAKSRRENSQVAALMAAAMSKSSIGVQQILPRTGTTWQGAKTVQDAKDAEDRPDEEDGDPSDSRKRALPAPGTGTIVDRTV